MTEAIPEDLAVSSPPKRRRRKSKPKPQNSDPEDSDFSGSESSESDADIEEVIPNEECRRNRDERVWRVNLNSDAKHTEMAIITPRYLATKDKGKGKAKSGAGVGSGKSYFGEREIIEITEGAKWNTRKLRVHLNSTSLPHFQLFRILQARSSSPLDRERTLACDAIELTAEISVNYVEMGKRLNQNIKEMFEKQQSAAKVSWDQDHFETLVAKWVATCDQPFIAVTREEFCEMLHYTHRHSPNPLHIPGPDSVKGKIVKMSDEMSKK
ncbi:hypothetical protein K438DRAFT_1779437 [Mycena galopus ATCC 62051]|nr:hypothetical protein K438DRAFT_1779437 [Mycena galopus ATCC 62051]